MIANHIWLPSVGEPVASICLRLFALKGTDNLGRNIRKLLAHPLSAHEERDFEDGEHKARPLDPVGGADIYLAVRGAGLTRQNAAGLRHGAGRAHSKGRNNGCKCGVAFQSNHFPNWLVILP